MNRYMKQALYGALGGIAGTFVLGTVRGAIHKLQSDDDQKREQALVPEQPTEKLARRISENVLGIALENEDKTARGQVIQWGYGAFWGAVYGVLRNRVPQAAWGAGLPFGVSFALFGQALLLPLMDLTPPAHKFPVSAVARDVVSHYAYAATVGGVCRACEAVEHAVTEKPLRTKPELRQVS